MSLYTKSEGSWYEAIRSYIKLSGEWIIVADGVGSLDKIPPTVTVSAPMGTLISEPTYYTTNSIYKVTGTVMDGDSGVMAVYVNDRMATIDGENWYYNLALNANTITKVTVYAIDNKGNQSDPIERYVVYDSAAPSLAISAPTGSSSSSPTYTASASYTVKGTTSDILGIKSLTVNGNIVTIGSDGSWSHSIVLTANTPTEITVIATDKADRTTVAKKYIYYDTTNPTLTISAPTGTSSSSPTYVQSDGTYNYTVSGSASDISGIKSLTVNGNAVSVGSDGKWSKALSLATNTTHTITVVATDNADRKTTVTRYVRVSPAISLSLNLAYAGGSGFTNGTINAISTSPTYTKKGDITVSGQSITIGRSCTLNANLYGKFQTNPGCTTGFYVYVNGTAVKTITTAIDSAYRTEISGNFSRQFNSGDVVTVHYYMSGSSKKDYEINSCVLTLTE